MKASSFGLIAIAVFLATPSSVVAQSQPELNNNATDRLEQVDRRLNESYKSLLDSRDGDPSFATVLRNAQRAWLQYVDLHMEAVFPLVEGEDPREVYGSSYPLEFAMEKAKLMEQRIRLLDEQLGGDSLSEEEESIPSEVPSGKKNVASRIRESVDAVTARYGDPTFTYSEGGFRYSEYFFRGKNITIVFRKGKSALVYITLPFSKVQTREQGVEALKFPKFALSLLKNLYEFGDEDFKMLESSKEDKGYRTYYTHSTKEVSVVLRTNPGALQMTNIFGGYLRVCDVAQSDEASTAQRDRFIDKANAAKKENSEKSRVDGF